MWITEGGSLYRGDMRPGDWEATPEEVAAWEQVVQSARAREAKDAADAQDARADAQLAAIAAMTPAQAAQWVEDNVTTLAQAKSALKILAKAICVLARKI